MGESYNAQNEIVLGKQLKVQELALNFSIVGNATPASKVVSVDDPALLFLNVQGISGITVASGAVDSSEELSAITFSTATDSSGVFNILVRIDEPVLKVCAAYIVQRNGANVTSATLTSAPSNSITSGGNKFVFNATAPAAFTSGTYDACLVVKYEASPL